MSIESDNRAKALRWSAYAVLIALSVGNMAGRLLAVNSVDLARLERARIDEVVQQERSRLVEQGVSETEIPALLERRRDELTREMRLQRPFLSSNDRSRWMAVRALVEYGRFDIDPVFGQRTWDSIDVVRHRGRDGELHFYSSKPPLLSMLVAIPYWVIVQTTGATLGTHPYAVGRGLLFLVNILPLAVMFVLLARLAERFGMTDWGRIFVVAVATMGTLLGTFAVVLNNHTVAAVSAAVAVYAYVRIACDGRREWRYFVVAGLAAAFTAACELPALSFLAALGAALFLRAPRQTALAFVPAAAVVAVASLVTNYAVHASWRPPYAHRSATDPEDNWYEYTYEVDGQVRESYWMNRQGIDRGEASRAVYALHVLVGHHGIFSLTPVWLLSIYGAGLWLSSRGQGGPELDRSAAGSSVVPRELAILVIATTLVCLVFYIGLRPLGDRNYGGMTSGFRWMFWFAPLWILMLVPAADRLACCTAGKAFCLALLALSVLSAAYPTWNPWTHPWIYQWMEYLGGPLQFGAA